jgi:hypothetical protein
MSNNNIPKLTAQDLTIFFDDTFFMIGRYINLFINGKKKPLLTIFSNALFFP